MDADTRLTASQRREAASVVLDELLPLIATQQVPAAHLIRHLTHVYWNMRYIGVDTALVARIQAAKVVGIEWRDFKDMLFDRYRGQDALDGGHRCAGFHAALSMIPDHLLDVDGNIVWNSERPHHTFEAWKRPKFIDE
ncbi:MAG: hypothetical protein WCK01_01545 [Candidatus Uhrbacteria bacterium]